MISSSLRNRVTVQSQVQTQDSTTGEIVVTWANFVSNVPAEVLTGPGREFRDSSAGQSEVTARIKMRWFPGLLPTMRIVWGSTIYNIRAIATDATARKDYRVTCTGGVNSGVN